MFINKSWKLLLINHPKQSQLIKLTFSPIHLACRRQFLLWFIIVMWAIFYEIGFEWEINNQREKFGRQSHFSDKCSSIVTQIGFRFSRVKLVSQSISKEEDFELSKQTCDNIFILLQIIRFSFMQTKINFMCKQNFPTDEKRFNDATFVMNFHISLSLLQINVKCDRAFPYLNSRLIREWNQFCCRALIQ